MIQPTATVRYQDPDNGSSASAKPLDTAWSVDKVAAYYAAYAPNYDRDIDQDPSMYPAPFTVASWIVQSLPSLPSKQTIRILDVGCGTGQSSAVFFSQQQSTLPTELLVHGVDASAEMLEHARRRSFASLTCHDIQEPLPFEDASFDAAVCIGVMDFVASPQTLLRHIARVLKRQGVVQGQQPGGLLGVTFPERHAASDLNAWTRNEIEEQLLALNTTADANGDSKSPVWRVERHQRLLGYKDSEDGHVTYYHAYLLRLISA
ncbi:hypothetical protein RI367_004764 [Sorochytrium milnesiophthora]